MNKSSEKGFLFVVSSPSGGGKSTILGEILKQDLNLSYSISYTTRKQRDYEENGKHYFFVSESEFEKMISQNEFLEWEKVHGNFYGTSRSKIEAQLQQGKNIVLDLDVLGALKLKEQNPRTILIFITVPSLEILEERLKNRKSETEETIKIRLERATKEMAFAEKYDHVIENLEIEKSVNEFKKIINQYLT